MKWISVKERPPEINQQVIALSNDGREIPATYENHPIYGDCFTFNNQYGGVSHFTHWMPKETHAQPI